MKPSRFLFDTDFAAIELERDGKPDIPAVPEIPMMPVADHQSKLAAAEKQAFERGRAAAKAEMADTNEARLGKEAARLAGEVGALVGELDTLEARREKDAVALAFLVARRICAHLIAREPLGEIVALISECLGPLRRAPHIVIRLRENDVDQLRERLDPVMREKGFEGRMVILGEPDIDRGDCRIEWADGGIVRDRKVLERDIDSAMRRYLETRRPGSSAANGQSNTGE